MKKNSKARFSGNRKNVFLERKAREIRRCILETVTCSKKGHIGGALSCVEILVALYHGRFLRFDASHPRWPERDRFILSKGHSSVALYAVLADCGFFSSEKLKDYCKDGGMLGGHPDRQVPGVEADTGSLGHGLGIGAGIALAAQMGNRAFQTVVLLGDGECYEGSVWEAAMFAGHHRLRQLIAIVDRNEQCVTDFTENCVRLESFADKWKSFDWEVREVDGHSFKDLSGAFELSRSGKVSKPLAIIAHTVKGKGISFMEKKLSWHHGIPTRELLEAGIKELEGVCSRCRR